MRMIPPATRHAGTSGNAAVNTMAARRPRAIAAASFNRPMPTFYGNWGVSAAGCGRSSRPR